MINQIRKTFLNEQRRAMDLSTVAPKESTVVGRAAINGAGEAYVDVTFPVKFADLPYFTFGFELKEFIHRPDAVGVITGGGKPIQGQMPVGSAYVAEWKTIERPPYSAYYTGARICCTIEGPAATKMIINYSFAGVALSNPSIIS